MESIPRRNPQACHGTGQHRARIREVIAERSELEGALGIGVLTAFASTYHSLGVASYTTVADQEASIGAFGVVVVMDSAKDD